GRGGPRGVVHRAVRAGVRAGSKGGAGVIRRLPGGRPTRTPARSWHQRGTRSGPGESHGLSNTAVSGRGLDRPRHHVASAVRRPSWLDSGVLGRSRLLI